VIHTFSLSKLGLPTSRTGIIVAEPRIIDRIARMNAQVVLATTTIGQTITGPLFPSGELARMCAEVVRPFYKEPFSSGSGCPACPYPTANYTPGSSDAAC
jgi:valine--pyruvate aminotransferase